MMSLTKGGGGSEKNNFYDKGAKSDFNSENDWRVVHCTAVKLIHQSIKHPINICKCGNIYYMVF